MPENILYIKKKLKSLVVDDTLYFALLIVLIAVASFGLGRQSVSLVSEKTLQNKSEISGVAKTKAAAPTVPPPTPNPPIPQSAGLLFTNQEAAVSVVASKSGTKYHLPTCSGAKSIKPENLITFESIEAAKAAGYSPASNCKGLE